MHTFWRVMTTPQGTGAPINLWPDTDTEPMGFLNETLGAFFMKGICAHNTTPQHCVLLDKLQKYNSLLTLYNIDTSR